MTDVFVAHKLVDKCEKKARCIIKDRGGRRNSKFTKLYDATKYLEMHTAGLIAECAMCIYLGLDPYTELDWQTKRADGGHDLSCNGHTIDVKASNHPNATRLMWPVKNADALDDVADVLVFARVLATRREKIGQTVDLVGFVPGNTFRSAHWKANGLRGIVDGTPYMNEKDLYTIDQIRQHLGHVITT